MRRSAIINNDHESMKTTEMSNHSNKRSLEDYGFFTNSNLKRRRHLSPQNSNIDLNSTNESIPSVRKKTRTKSKNQSPNEHQTPRVSEYSFDYIFISFF